VNERIVPSGPRTLIIPAHSHERIEWDFKDQSLRLFVDRKVRQFLRVQFTEGMTRQCRQLAQITETVNVTCAACSDAFTLVTGGSDNIVVLWKIFRASSNGTRLRVTHLMRGHSNRVTCIAASRAWSLVVSGGEDCSAILWDLNRATYVRSLWHERSVTSCAIHEISVRPCALLWLCPDMPSLRY
jgi:WD40 repeat protein